MSKIIGKYKYEDVTKDFESDYKYKIYHLTPTVTYRHKYWYFWEIELIFWKWNKRFEISRTDWKDHLDRDEKWFWKRFIKVYQKKNGDKTKAN